MHIKTTRRTLSTLALTAALAVVTACGGGGDGSTPTPPDGGPSATAGAIAFGTITQFGSVWVNGVEYETSGASVRVDDSPASPSDLRIGMVVRIDGSVDDRSAHVISVDGALKGRVEQVLDANRMVVMGQTVQIDAQTAFDDGVRPASGDYVEVHGLVAGAGTIAAGYVERKSALASPPYAVKGLVANHDPAAATFTIGALRVNYAGAVTGDMPAGAWNGLQVEAKGSSCAGNPVCGSLVASQVEPDGLGVDSTPHTEIEGFVTAATATGFVIGGQAVAVTPATRFEGGVAADVGVGSKVEVEGSLSGGVLSASKVSLRDNVRLEGNVASIDVAGGSFTLAGLPAVTISVNALTRLDHLASLTALGMSNHVRVKGRAGSGNAVAALELELRSTTPDGRVVLQGPVSEVVGTRSVRMLGTLVDTGSVPDGEFKDQHDASVGRAAFFAAVRPGTTVKARGGLGGGAAIIWDEMELED